MAKGNPMDALKAALAARQDKAKKVVADTGQKWVRRGDLEQKRKEEYLESKRLEEEKAKADEEERLQKFEAHLSKSKAKEEEQVKEIPAHILNDALLGDDDAEPPVGAGEVIDSLRELGHPITLFGETDMMRYRRLRTIQKEGDEGRKNPDLVMLENVHHQQQEEEMQAEEAEVEGGDEEDKGGGDDDDKSDTDEEPDPEAEDKGDTDEEGDPEERPIRTTEFASVPAKEGEAEDKPEEKLMLEVPEVDLALMDKCDGIRAWVRKALKGWEKELADIPEEEKVKAVVKKEIAAHRQVRRDVRTLQKRLRLYVVDQWLLEKLHYIVSKAANLEYRDASEAYLDLTIGKAAWPVGLGCGGSMLMEDAIGLHDRFNRNNQVKDIAFAMNDEPTRKFVQAVKRLMSVAQRFWPPSDPSNRC